MHRINSSLLQMKHVLRNHFHLDNLHLITLSELVDIRQREVRGVVKQPLRIHLANPERMEKASHQREDIAIYMQSQTPERVQWKSWDKSNKQKNTKTRKKAPTIIFVIACENNPLFWKSEMFDLVWHLNNQQLQSYVGGIAISWERVVECCSRESLC